MKFIQLHGIDANGAMAIVDDEDFDFLSQWKWYLDVSGYVVRSGSYYKKDGLPRVMHRLLLNAKKGSIIDHVNRKRLDNRKRNLRFCTSMQNSHNMGPFKGRKYKGVSKQSRLYRAHISFNGKNKTLGSYENKFDAIRAYNSAAIKYFGEFAYINPVKSTTR